MHLAEALSVRDRDERNGKPASLSISIFPKAQAVLEQDRPCLCLAHFLEGESGVVRAVTRCSTRQMRVKEENARYSGLLFFGRKALAHGSWEPRWARMDLGWCLVLGSFPGSPVPAMEG